MPQNDTTDRIEEIAGLLYVHMQTPDYYQPTMIHTFYPTGVEARWYTRFIGLPAHYRGDGLYQVQDGDSAQIIRLQNGGETRPDARYTREEPIPMPKRAHDARYERGAWEVYSVRYGWRRY